jgi:hypothetical protein
MRDFDKAMRTALSPGPHLDYQNLWAANSLKDSLEEVLLRSTINDPVQIGLYKWSRHAITLAATNGVYGNSNPFLDKRTEEAFW